MLSWWLLSTSSSALKCIHCGVQQSRKTWASHESYGIDGSVPERLELFKRQYAGESKAVYGLYVDTLQYRAPNGVEHCWSPSKLTCLLYGWERERELPLPQIGMVRKRQDLCLFGWERGVTKLPMFICIPASRRQAFLPHTIPYCMRHTCTRAWVYVRPSQSSCRLKFRPCPVCHFCLNVNLHPQICIKERMHARGVCMQEDSTYIKIQTCIFANIWLSQYHGRAKKACLLALRLLSMTLGILELSGLSLFIIGTAAGAFGILSWRVYKDFALEFGTIQFWIQKGIHAELEWLKRRTSWLFDGDSDSFTPEVEAVLDAVWDRVENAWDMMQKFASTMSTMSHAGWRLTKRSILLMTHSGWQEQSGKGKLRCHSLYACAIGDILWVGELPDHFMLKILVWWLEGNKIWPARFITPSKLEVNQLA